MRNKRIKEDEDLDLTNIKLIFEEKRDAINNEQFKNLIVRNHLKLPKFLSDVLFKKISNNNILTFKEFKS